MTTTQDPRLDRLFGAGIGQPWLDWRRKVALVPDGAALLDHVTRADFPGDDAQWARLADLQERAKALCGAQDDDGSWEPPPPDPPPRVPPSMWRGMTRLEQTDAVDRVGEWVADWHNPTVRQRRGLLLVGPVGSGKTAIAAAAAHDTDGWAFWPLTDLVQHLMDGYSDNSFGYRFGALARRRLLIVDDLGSERDTDGQVDLVVKLIDHRHRAEVHTVVTTNLRHSQREVRYGKRFESRLRDMCETVPVTGEDRRQT